MRLVSAGLLFSLFATSLGWVAGIGLGAGPQGQSAAAPNSKNLPVLRFHYGIDAEVAASEGWADSVTAPDRITQRIAQVLVGEQLRVVDSIGNWSLTTGGDNLKSGWIRSSALRFPPNRSTNGWPKAWVVKSPGIDCGAGLYLPFAASLPSSAGNRGQTGRLALPGGREIEVDAADISLNPLSLGDAVRRMGGFRGVSYQRGGNTRDGMDAAGLIYLAYRVTGVGVPRTVMGLIEAGEQISLDTIETGNVVFLSTYNPNRPHPVLMVDGNLFIHASPSQGVAYGLLSDVHSGRILQARRYRQDGH